MEKVQKPRYSECYTLLSEPFRIYLCGFRFQIFNIISNIQTWFKVSLIPWSVCHTCEFWTNDDHTDIQLKVISYGNHHTSRKEKVIQGWFHSETHCEEKGKDVYCLLGWDTVEPGRSSPKFWRNILIPSTGWKSKHSKQGKTSTCLFACWTFSDPEDRGSTFLQNIGIQQDYAVSHCKRLYFS
jgi:hypothetical protein